MSDIEYFHVFESILYGLTLANLLYGIGKFIKLRNTVEHYWMYYMALAMTVLTVIRQYYTGFSASTFELVDSPWTFMLFVVVNPSLFVLMSQVMIPQNIEGTNLRSYIQRHIRELYLLIIISNFIQITENISGSYVDGKFQNLSEFLLFAGSLHFLTFFVILFTLTIGAAIGFFANNLRYSEVYVSAYFVFILLIVFLLY